MPDFDVVVLGTGAAGLTAAIMAHDGGARVGHGRPYHPQTQGKDERFHRTLKAEVLDGKVFTDLSRAQRAFDAWREVYNTIRPHQALDMATPSTRYVMSQRVMPRYIEPPDYEPGVAVRRVHNGGAFQFNGHIYYCSGAFSGLQVALRPAGPDGLFNVCYRSHVISQINLAGDPKTVHHVSAHPFTLSLV